MKNNTVTTKVALGLTCGLALASATSVLATNEFSYSSVGGAAINFIGGGQFDFTPSASFQIISSSFGTGANGLLGGMSGTYTMTGISGNTANVTGSGGFSITDASNVKLTGTLTWLTVSQTGTGNTLDFLGAVNLTGLSYAGSNPVLQDLAVQTSVIDTLSFTFVPMESLTQLANTTSPLSTTFSGTIAGTTSSLPDGGTTVALLGGALTAMGIVRSKLGKK